MSSFGDKFKAQKLEVKQELNVKTYTDAADASTPASGQVGDVWFVVNNTTEANNGVFIYLPVAGSSPVTYSWQQCAQMNAGLSGA